MGFQKIVLLAAAVLVGCSRGPSARQKFSDGVAAYKAGEWEKAAKLLSEASETVAASDELSYLLGSSLLKQGDLDNAAKAYSDALKIRPRHGEALAGLAQIAFLKGELNEAQRYYSQALRADLFAQSSRAAIYNGLALIDQERKDPAGARLNLLLAQRADGMYAPTYYNLGALYGSELFKLLDEAYDQYNLYLRLPVEDQAHFDKAKNKCSQLEAAIKRNAPKEPTLDANQQKKLETLVDAGSEALAVKKFANAAKSFREAAKLNPASFNAHWGLGMAATRLGQNAEALEAFKKSAELRPVNLESYSRAATLAFQLKKYDVAERMLNAAFARSPFNAELAKQLSSLYYYQNRPQAAKAYGQYYLSLLKGETKDAAFERWLKNF